MKRALIVTTVLAIGVAIVAYAIKQAPTAIAQNDSGSGSPLDVTSGLPEPIRLEAGSKQIVSARHAGGSGYSWRATSQNPAVATITYLSTRSDKARPEMVGSEERDFFELQGHMPGTTQVQLDLRRVRGDPIKSQTISVEVRPSS